MHLWQRSKCHHWCPHFSQLELYLALWKLYTGLLCMKTNQLNEIMLQFVWDHVCTKSLQLRNYIAVLFILQMKLLLKEWNTKHKTDWHLTTTTPNKEAGLIQSVIIVHNPGQAYLPPITVKVYTECFRNWYRSSVFKARSSLMIPLRLCLLVGWDRYVCNICRI